MTETCNLLVGSRRIAYKRRTGSRPTLVFLSGYASDMEGTKAVALDTFAEQRSLAFLRFDYSGTGASSGHFEDGTLEKWFEEAVTLIDQRTEGPLIVIGSSMGGWIGLHLGLARPDRVRALIGIAAAPDFTDWAFSADRRAKLLSEGRLEESGPDTGGSGLITRAFWQSGQRLRLLGREIGIDCPVRLIHGECDRDVPLEVAFQTMRALRSGDVHLNIVKDGNHRLSRPHEIEVLLGTVAALLERVR